VKGAKAPVAFTGKDVDARPFLDRVENWFELQPKSYLYTRSRILATCALIVTYPADSWAIEVSNAVRKEAGLAYTDSWDDFKETFLSSFGIANETEDAYAKIQRLRQGSLELQVYSAEFNRLQKLAEISDKEAFRFYRKGIDRKLFWRMSLITPPPSNLREYIERAVATDRHIKEMHDFDTNYRVPSQKSQPSHPQSHKPVQFARTQLRPYAHPHRDPNAMDVDSMNQRDSRAATSRPSHPIPRTTNVRPTVPAYGPRPIVDSKGKTTAPSNRPIATCHLCKRPGHFMRDCKADLSKLDQHHIRALLTKVAALDLTEEEPVREPSPEPELADEEEYDAFLMVGDVDEEAVDQDFQ